MYILNFAQAPAVFYGSGVSLHFSTYQDALLIFQKTIFGNLTVLAGLCTAWPRAGVFVHLHFMRAQIGHN
jgi:hypothetical protein